MQNILQHADVYIVTFWKQRYTLEYNHSFDSTNLFLVFC